jgi:small GTP-binding protein
MDSTEIFKCVAVGDEKAGTTRMIMCLAGGSFSNEYIPTMFENYSLSYNDECTIDIWDTGGMDSNDQVRSLSYSQADVVVINFSLIEPISFENVTRKWFPEVRKHLKTVPIILVGNKLDMRDDQDTAETLKSKGQVPITYYEGLKLAKEINAAKYLECSALTTKGVNAVSDEIFRIASLNA